jgi:hypothetical protein
VALVLVGCGAGAEAEPWNAEPAGTGATRAAALAGRCDGAVLPECDGPFTGVTCDLPCIGDDPTACGVDVYCHSDGTVYGVATRNAVLFPGSASDGDGDIAAALEAWILAHEAELGLDEGMAPEDLELALLAASSSSAGPLRILRFSLAAQVGYHLFQSWYDFIDGRLTDPVTGAKRWDSATYHYSNGGTTSDTPPGTYAPRVIGFVNTVSADCPVNGTACATVEGFNPTDPAVMAFPELLHIPAGATNPEALGLMILPGDGIEPVTFAHELGHIIDLFTGGGMTIDFAPACGGACTLECVEDTTDEAPALSESIAQLLALAFLHQSFGAVEFDYCPTVDLVSVNGNKPWTPGGCVPSGEDISLFQRPAACAKPALYCDKPEDPGTRRECCFDSEDLTDCTILVPEECQVGAIGPMGGVGTGTARAAPTGLCSTTPGYATNSLYQAFWQMLNGQRCEPVAPFASPWSGHQGWRRSLRRPKRCSMRCG